MSPDLSLVVQYATPAGELPRWRLRRWVLHALRGIGRAGGPDGKALRNVILTLRLVDADEGRRLNHEFRGRDYATNVLTFEYGTDPGGTASGDVVLCVPVLHREAAEQGKPLLDHAAHLTVHGVLHALGYDHIDADEALAMEALEIEILGKMGISDPYQA
jgi:probable rRNA maturation factor